MSNYNFHPSTGKRGFTLVEMLIIAPIVLLTIGAFITVIVNMTGDVLASRGSNVLAYNIQDALNRIEDDVKLSTGFLAINNISTHTPSQPQDISSPQGYNDNTSDFTNVSSDATKGNMLILNTLATTGNPFSSTSGLVYLNSQPNDCSTNPTQINQNTPMTMNVVYYVKTVGSVSSLWRRTIAPSNYLTAGMTTAGCTVNPVVPIVPWQQPSCTPGYVATFCKTEDVKLIDGINPTDFVVQYYNTADATTTNTAAVDTGSDDSDRGSAMQATATVGVSINVSKSIAGRTVSQSGTLRATRLDVNASTLAPAVILTTPAAPTVTASIVNPTTAPTTVTFSWPTVGGATAYTFKYNTTGGVCSSGSWTTLFTNQNTTSQNVVGAHNQVLYACVTASNASYTSDFGTTSITIPLWAPMIFQNNWTNYGGTRSSASFTKTANGMVILQGLVKSGTATSGLAIATLPAGYCPDYNTIFQNGSNNAAGRIDVWADCTVRFQIGSNAWFGLDGISFMAAGVGTWTSITPLASWINTTGTFANPLAYMADDGAGRVRIKGMIQGGTTTSGTLIGSVPSTYLPSLYSHIGMDSGNANGHFSLYQTTGGIIAKGYSNAWYSLNALYHPSTYPASGSCPAATSGWCAFTFQNSWQNYTTPPYASGGYTKGSDGVVELRGLLNGGAIGTVITTLPAGYRPKTQLLMPIESNAAYGALDIYPNGNVVASIGNNTWVSLDSVTFMAEQ